MNKLILDGLNTEVPIEVDSELTRLSGLSYAKAEAIQYSLGTAPGCHQPLLYAISRLVSEGKIKSIMELGSGMTTIFFQALSKNYGIPVVSIENHPQWYGTTMKALEILNLGATGYFQSNNWFDHNQIGKIHDGPFDLVLIDHAPSLVPKGVIPTGDRLHRITVVPHVIKSGYIGEQTILMWDDCEQRTTYETTVEIAKTMKLPKPKLWQSQSRGISTIDPIGLIDFVKYKWE